MSLELLGALSSLGTFIVIAATAVAALIQLRHLRSNNQIATMARLETLDASPEVQASKMFIFSELPERMKDPGFRKLLSGQFVQGEARRILAATNLYEQMGNYVRHDFIDRDFVLDNYAGQIVGIWRLLDSAIPILRRAQGEDNLIWFEYLASLAKQYLDGRRGVAFPSGTPRLPLDTTWLDADSAAKL